jgi:hypothetical protein
MMSRKQWVRYHELKHLVTRLGCTMQERQDETLRVQDLCEEILWVVVNIRAEYAASPHPTAKKDQVLHPSAA